MASQVAHIRVVLIAFCVMLSACGSGSADLNSTPSPPPTLVVTPPPSSSQLKSPVSLLNAPATQEFSTFSVGDSLRIRYDAALDKYEVMAPGKDWDALVDDPLSEPGLSLFASVPNLSSGHVSATRYNHPAPELRYQYSSLARWSLGTAGSADMMTGIVVLGAATASGGVPLSGSASYQGIISGSANIVAKSGWGDFDRAPIGGTVSLQFDFSQGSLKGQIRPQLACDCESMKFPTLDFVQTVFAIGSSTFFGKFNTEVGGQNTFSGALTGPRAEELIGKWAFPFVVDQTAHSATGVWIAKRGN